MSAICSATRRRGRRVRSVAVCLAGLTVLAACGATSTVRSGQSLAVSLSEDRVTPQRVEAPSGVLTVEVHNNGRLTHDLVISRAGAITAQTGPLGPGQGAQLTAVLVPGTYQLASTMLSDQGLGAYGTLRVSR